MGLYFFASPLRLGVAANGLTTAALTVDLTRTPRWTSTTFFVTTVQMHGRGPSTTRVVHQQRLRNIEATPSTTRSNLWLESQCFGDRLNIRIGQGGANDALLLVRSAALLLRGADVLCSVRRTNLLLIGFVGEVTNW